MFRSGARRSAAGSARRWRSVQATHAGEPYPAYRVPGSARRWADPAPSRAGTRRPHSHAEGHGDPPCSRPPEPRRTTRKTCAVRQRTARHGSARSVTQIQRTGTSSPRLTAGRHQRTELGGIAATLSCRKSRIVLLSDPKEAAARSSSVLPQPSRGVLASRPAPCSGQARGAPAGHSGTNFLGPAWPLRHTSQRVSPSPAVLSAIRVGPRRLGCLHGIACAGSGVGADGGAAEPGVQQVGGPGRSTAWVH